MNRIELINSQIDRIQKLKVVQKSGYISEVETLRERLNDKTFRLAVVGEFSSGKSTFINAIIGKDVLKHAATETTATVTYIYNVSSGDIRLNTCEIEYAAGNIVSLSDLNKLRDYTTVNSEINVAESIRSVSIYVNFLNVDYPIVITDTPGLNGIADKHREITLNEIKKAHACIYLLSSNGVKLTDLDFINILLNYQKKFIFIQNFIDLLRSSEGETIQNKIANDIANLNVCFRDEKSEVSYQVYGISAVKALAARDVSQNKVFEEDVENIRDRKKLFEESDFAKFENCLYKMIESGEYLEVMEDSVIYTLDQIIERIKNNLKEECELNEQLKAKDDKTKSIEKAQKIIDRLNSKKEDQKKRLKNFLVSRDSENRHSLHEYTKRILEELFEYLVSDLEEKVKTYEEFVTFANYHDGEEPPEYYGKCISSHLNGQIVPGVDTRIQENLSHLYNEAILKVSNSVTIVDKTKEKIDIEVNNRIAEFSGKGIQDGSKTDKIEVQIKRNRIKSMEDSIRDKNAQKRLVDQDISVEKQKHNTAKQQYEREKQRIGADPGVKKKKVSKEKSVPRGIPILGFLADLLFGEKTETYWVYEDDYSEQNEWKKEKTVLEERNHRVQESHNQRMCSLESRKRALQDEVSMNSNIIEKLKRDILDLEKRAKREKEIYERTLKANEQEYCDNEKRKLKEEFLRVLLDTEHNASAIKKINAHIDNVDLEYLPVIQKKVLKYYADSVRNRIDSLTEIIRSNETELEARYTLSKKELAVLDEVVTKIHEKG